MFVRVHNAKLMRQLAGGKHRNGKIVQILMTVAPRHMDEFIIARAAEQLAIAIQEILVHLAERGDFGRADKREILRPEKQAQPFALVGFVGNNGEIGPAYGRFWSRP